MKYIESRLLASAIFILSLILPNIVWAENEFQLTVIAKPTMAGSFNKSSATLEAGRTIQLVAYANNNFTFVQWTDESGAVISKQMNLNYVMPGRNVTLTAEYEYNPTNPVNPVQNYWNKLLGEVIIDDFTSGSLQNAVKNVISDSKATDVMMITVAGVMNANDFGIINTYSACTLLDLSRITGVTQIPSYAFDNTKLETVYMPATIESIGTQAFYGCRQLSSMIIYAMSPPSLGSNVFTNVPDGLVVYVPASSISLYQDAAGWKDFTILPIQEDIRNIFVSLPEGTLLLDYTNMWLELTNTKNGQRMHYVMTDRTQYTFANIIRNTSWNVTLRNERGDVFGQIDNVEVKDEDVSVTFSSLSKPQSVVLSVLTPDGQDVTTQTQVTWTDAQGNYVAQGVSLTGLPTGYQTTYHVLLSQELAMAYNTPQPVDYVLTDGDNRITYQLNAIPQVKISGKVKDASTGLPLSGAVVSASQTFGGHNSKTLNAKTNGDGVFTLDIANVPTSVAFAASDYVSQTINCDSLLTGAEEVTLPDVLLKTITGATITLGFTYTSCDGETQNWYSDYQNVSYELVNVTRNKAVSQYNVQYPQIVLLEEVADGDVLRLTATSRTNAFMPVTATATITEQKAETTFAVVELGKIQSSFTSTGNAAVVGSLYDAAGKLVKTYDYANASLTINDLADGQYTLVSMGSSRLFNTIYDLSQLPQTGLTEGTDYVKNMVQVQSGIISAITIDEVPTLDESKLYYTGDNTSFTVNKPSIVVGNYLTLTGRIDFKPAYATSVSNMQMVVDLPESCQFVENSVMVGNSTSSYTLNGNQITIPMARYTDRVRFCIIPTLGGEYSPSAFVQFDLNGETVIQPIGSANYTAKDLSISVPSTVAKTSIPVSGTAIGTSNIEIYDNDVLIGQTTSMANGTWATTCELNEPYNLSAHNIYAKITTKNGVQLISERGECLYDMNAIEISKVTMYHWNPEVNSWRGKNYEVVFDFQNPSAVPQKYIYYIYNKTFTFTIDFSNNDTTKIDNVMLRVKLGNGEWKVLPADYDKKISCWVATGEFGNMYDGNVPINVGVSFDRLTTSVIDGYYYKSIYDSFNEDISYYKAVDSRIDSLSQLTDVYLDALDFESALETIEYLIGEKIVLEDTENYSSLSYEELESVVEEIENGVRIFTNDSTLIYKELDKAVRIYENLTDTIFRIGEYTYRYSRKTCGEMNRDSLIENGYVLIPMNGGEYFEYISESYCDFIDMCNNVRTTILIDVGKLSAQIGSPRRFSIGDFFTGPEYSSMKDMVATILLDENNLVRWFMDVNPKRADILNQVESWSKRTKSALATVKEQRKIAVGMKEIRLMQDEANLTQCMKDLGKTKAKNTLSPRIVSNTLSGALSAFDWGQWYKDMKNYENRIKKLNVPYCIYQAKPKAAALLDSWIQDVEKRFKDFYLRQFGRRCIYDIANLTPAALLLIYPEQKAEAIRNELFKNDVGADITRYGRMLARLSREYCKEGDYPKEWNEDAYWLDSQNSDADVSIDPSGYVYEGVFSNRVEGALATVFYKEEVEDMYGDLHENIVKWDAEEYAQENPLFTDENGFYRWDVPQGLWQVKFEKEGYETTYSEWLPVPPPQLDVNIAMKQNRQPEVKAARAFEDAVEVEFDKYMIPELLTTENIMVIQNGTAVEGIVKLLNEEVSYEGETETFASKIRFNATQPFTEQEITLMVNNRVKSYAGIRMQDDYQQKFTIEQEIKQIAADSVITVGYGNASTLTVSVLPASASKGKTLTVKTSSPMILSVETEQVTIGNDGKAEITVSGELPGTAALTFSVEGTDKTAMTIANVEQIVIKTVATPKASIASGSVVDTGTQITLSCETDGVIIYYTIDGSCPCDNASRIKYDGTPIVINEGVTIKVIAVAPNGIESEVAEFVYTTKDEEDAIIQVPTTTTSTKDTYDISGRKVGRKAKGIIIRNNNGTNRKVLVK